MTTVKNMCSKAGLVGKFTNHSLRATSASRMYQSHISEQIIKEIKGHRSDCVRTYKRTFDEIRKDASNKISGESVEEVSETNVNCEQESSDVKSKQSKNLDQCTSDYQRKRNAQSLAACQVIKNVIKTRMELCKKGRSNVQCLKKIARKLVKKQRQKKSVKDRKNVKSKDLSNKYVIDLNVNLNIKK